MPKLGDKFWLAKENFASEPEVGKYATPTANSTLFTVADAAATEGLCLYVETTKPLTLGMVDDGELYYCRVVNA